jgi:uncharacterized protein YcfJ
MVQPKYSPEEALERVKLMMKYDTSKTLNENKKVIFEQSYVDPSAVGAGVVTAAAGAYAGAAIGTGIVPIAGTAIGALVGLGLGALGNWATSADKGEDGFRKVMEACNASGASKLVPKLSKTEVRNIAYKIEDAKGAWNDDEDAIVSALMEIPTIADLCAVDKKIAGGLAEFLDNLTDDPEEWKMFTRPLEGIIEDSEIVLTPEEQEQADGVSNSGGSTTSGYKSCSGTYSYGCKSDAIKTVQGCLSLVTDGKFGPKTQAALKAKGFDSFTDADVNKICSKTTEEEPEVSGESPSDADQNNLEF